mgnify:CR=1 FL=1
MYRNFIELVVMLSGAETIDLEQYAVVMSMIFYFNMGQYVSLKYVKLKNILKLVLIL